MTAFLTHSYGSETLKGISYIKTLTAHYLNPLHVYCRLNKVLGKTSARAISRAYEVYIFNVVKGV